MSLRKFIEETERQLAAPITGDQFDFQINESLSIECDVIEHSQDSYIVSVDEAAYEMLKEADLIVEGKECTECGMGTMYTTSEGKMQCDECGYSSSPVAEAIDDSKINYAVEYSVSGSDDDQTNVLRVIPVEITDSNRMMYPEYIRSSLEKHPINKEMKDQGYRPKRTRAAWRGDLGHQLELARESAKDKNLIASELQYRKKNLEELEFANKHIDGKPYKTRYGNVVESAEIDEAEYQGRQVTLGKPTAGDVKKYKVYVRDPKTGNIKKVNFGDKGMSIKRDNPARRKNFRARHNCSSKKDRTSAGYWSCRMWSKKPVSQILKGK